LVPPLHSEVEECFAAHRGASAHGERDTASWFDLQLAAVPLMRSVILRWAMGDVH